MTSRGRGRDSFPYRGRGRSSGGRLPLIHYGNSRLINADISGNSLLRELENNPTTLRKVQEFLKANSSEEGQSSSFAKIVVENDDDGSYEKKSSSQNQDIILFLENKDLQWKDNPWDLLQRYLGTASYAVGSYKQRTIYESMLKATESIEMRHFLPNPQSKTYNFSRIIIKQIISVEEWGLNPLCEKEFHMTNQNTLVKFNFWDYKEAFYKTFFYQNPQKKHTWWIKICPLVYKRRIPNWLYDWWIIFGADEKILPSPFIELFNKWKQVSPAVIEAEYDKTICHNMVVLHFFCEFGIPWIWKWEPEVGHSNNIPCLKRIQFIKFWKKMLRIDESGQMEGQQTISQIEEKIVEYEEKINTLQQRQAFNPFDIIEERIINQKMSRQEHYKKFMEEAKQAILKKLGSDMEIEEDDSESRISTKEGSAMFQDSQDPFDMENDANMAEFYEKLYSEERKDKTDTEAEDNSEEDNRARTRKKKGKAKTKKK